MFNCKVRLGSDPELAFPATLTVTETEFVIREVGRDPLVLTPSSVVSIEVLGFIPFVTQVIRVRYRVGGKSKAAVLMPQLSTCRRVMAGIRHAGFTPAARGGPP
jgi:hypothetical protein